MHVLLSIVCRLDRCQSFCVGYDASHRAPFPAFSEHQWWIFYFRMFALSKATENGDKMNASKGVPFPSLSSEHVPSWKLQEGMMLVKAHTFCSFSVNMTISEMCPFAGFSVIMSLSKACRLRASVGI